MAIESTDPKECFLGFCLPMSREEYDASLAAGHNRDFIRAQCQKNGKTPDEFWNDVYSIVADDFRTQIDIVERHGVRVKLDFKTSDLPLIRSYKVFSLFAHYDCDRGLMELADGLITPVNFANLLPSDYTGLYDVTACFSVHVRDAIKMKYGNQAIAFGARLNPTLMLLFYKAVIQRLAQYEINYVDCYTRVIEDYYLHSAEEGRPDNQHDGDC